MIVVTVRDVVRMLLGSGPLIELFSKLSRVIVVGVVKSDRVPRICEFDRSSRDNGAFIDDNTRFSDAVVEVEKLRNVAVNTVR